jgi:HPt (histidine-containing phosphotransfer) domain-containing protein
MVLVQTDPPNTVWALPEALQQLVLAGDADLVTEILDMYKADTATRLEGLRAATAGLDRARVKAQAHAIKGSSIQVGANSLAAICQRIETEAETLEFAELSEMVSEAVEDFDRICALVIQL